VADPLLALWDLQNYGGSRKDAKALSRVIHSVGALGIAVVRKVFHAKSSWLLIGRKNCRWLSGHAVERRSLNRLSWLFEK
jgi:hypothetical protein